jgi:S1-C subfamily serine protease
VKVVLLSLCVACASNAHDPGIPRAREAQGLSTVRVDAMCIVLDPFSDGDTPKIPDSIAFGSGMATGVIVSNRHILTANHAVACPEIPYVTVVFPDGHRRRTMVIREDVKLDLALLEVQSADPIPGAYPPTIGSVQPGDPVCSVTAAPTWGWNCGTVDKFYDRSKKGDIGFRAHIAPGNSGSGLYDIEGRLVGITVMMAHDSDQYSFATSLNDHRWMLP